jgi:steroid delta-isomerase-like uncharacterized protein
MSAEQNKANLRRLFIETMSKGDLSVADELLTPDHVSHGLQTPVTGREGFKMAVAMFRAAFPDMQVTIDDVIAEGDKVASHGTMAGTHAGDFLGIPPTGRHIILGYSDMWTVENGQFTEHSVQHDLLGLMQQLGAIPSPQ